MFPHAAPSRPIGPMPKPMAAKLPPWGWLEWYVVVQALLPALLFVPGVGGNSVIRNFTRIASFLIALVAWAWIWRSGRRAPAGKPFPAIPWLTACSVWLILSIFHPNMNSLASGFAHVAMYLTVLSPAFWAPSAVSSSRQVSRVMMITFFACALNIFLGIGQVYRPGTFNPPYIPAVDGGNVYSIGGATYKSASGQTIVRPCGLSDNPGQAAPSGAIGCLIGLSLAVRPIAGWKRLAGLGVAFAGVMVIYFSQMRSTMVMAFVCVVVMGFLFAARGYFRQATLLGIGSLALVVGGAVAAVGVVGEVATKRFMTLIETRPDELYGGARGGFVQETFEAKIWDYPLGAGLGRWGVAYSTFGDHYLPVGADYGTIWVEVQWPGWVVDGGVPLMVLYVLAIVLAMGDSFRIALTCRDRELAYWAAVICGLNLSVVAGCFSACPFLANNGMWFWLSAAMLHAADLRARQEARRRSPAVGSPA
jgi:hypothetical protein